MRNRIPTEQQNRLEDALRRQGRATRPEFSQQLHERISQAVQQGKSSPARPVPKPPWRLRLAPLTVAAALVLGVSLTTWWYARQPASTPAISEREESTADPLELASQTGRTAEDFGRWIDSALSQQQWGYLDHDLQLATQLFIQQLPLTHIAEEEVPSSPSTNAPQETSG